MYVDRTLEAVVARASAQFPVLLLTGARQVGKTTLLHHVSGPERRYVSLDDPLVASLAKTDPPLFMQRFPPPVLVDEIQYAPELLPHVKMSVDRSRNPGAFWITGSQHFHLMKGVSESLAGRVSVLHLAGLTRWESLGEGAVAEPFVPTREATNRRVTSGRHLTLKTLYDVIWRGTLPAIALDDTIDRDLFYGGYVQTYLQRDLRDLARVGNETSFLRFLRVAAGRTGSLLNLADMARDADIAPNTAKSWLSILETSGVVYLLQSYHANFTKRLVKAPKLYFLDTGLAAYLTAWGSPEALEIGAMSSAFFETWVVGEVVKSYWHNGLRAPVSFYRDKDRREIDLLIERDGMIYPVEIKKTASPRRDDARHFKALDRREVSRGPGAVVCVAAQSLPLTDRDVSIPAGAV